MFVQCHLFSEGGPDHLPLVVLLLVLDPPLLLRLLYWLLPKNKTKWKWKCFLFLYYFIDSCLKKEWKWKCFYLLSWLLPIWGSGLLFALTLRPGGLGSPQIGGFCERVAFWGERWAISAFFHCVLPKKPYAPLQCFFPLFTPQKAISSLTVLFEESYGGDTVEKSTVRDYMAFWGENSGKKQCKGAYGFLGRTQWKKALIAHLLPKKPPSRKSHQFEVT